MVSICSSRDLMMNMLRLLFSWYNSVWMCSGRSYEWFGLAASVLWIMCCLF
ncbi:hypothetical protein Hanom_Chr09g00814111 [Helianthus anomalus]